MSEAAAAHDACVIERIVEAPVAVVWQMWTDPEHFKQWYGPQGFTVPVVEMDVRVGGKHLFCMQSPDGNMQMWSTGEYIEVVPNARLVYTDSPADAEGNVKSPAEMGMPEGYPAETVVTVELEDLDGRTKMVMTHVGVPASAKGGWEQAFAKLDGRLEAVLRKG
jgi:uncharacterized protein YndB with AHSA1/START domain